MDEILSFVNEQVFGVWFLIGAALVFWMQAGFAMVEAGFTRAKNSGNIIMKNLMDFCIGTVMWFLIGASLMLPTEGGDIMGLCKLQLFRICIQPGILCYDRHNRIRFHGGENEIFHLLSVFRYHIRYYLSDRSALDMG